MIDRVESALQHRDVVGASQTGRRGLGWSRRQWWASSQSSERHHRVVDEVQQECDNDRRVKAVQQSLQGQWTRWEGVQPRRLRWSDLQAISPHRLSFLIRGVYDLLPTGANLHRWGYASQPDCPLCRKVQTLDHVLSSCSVALGQGRFTWRHNCVLRVLQTAVAARIAQASPVRAATRKMQFVREGVKIKKKTAQPKINAFDGADDWTLACDLRGEGRYPRLIAKSGQRPDLVAVSLKAKRVVIVELTVPFEVRVLERHEYKTAKYEDLCQDLRRAGFKVDFFAVEVGARGFAASSLLAFVRWMGGAATCRRSVLQKLTKAAEDSSYWIWCQRNTSLWQNSQPGEV